MICLTFGGNKGGTGKTTSCQNIGVVLAERGYRVLMVDCDSQGNLSESLGVDIENLEKTLYEVLQTRNVNEAIIENIRNGMDLIPANVLTDYANIEFASTIPRLKSILNSISENYDFCLMDTSTYLTPLTRMAVLASDSVITCATAGKFSIKGSYMMKNLIDNMNDDYGTDINLLGVIMTMYAKTNLAYQTKDVIESILGDKVVFFNKVRTNVKINESQSEGLAVVEKHKKSNGNIDYRNLTKEIAVRLGVIKGSL